MLTELSIENFALVDKQRLLFGPGLNILTGETGAGKSILLDALGLVLGERAGAEMVRHGAEKARVEAVFAVAGENEGGQRLRESLDAAGVETDEDGLLILSRDLSAAGKSQVRINGRAATVGMLKSIGDALVDIHGQHEHQSLLAVERHADILDAWCGPETLALKTAVAEAHGDLQAVRRELAALKQDARERARNLDLLSFQRDEIDAAAPKVSEEEELIGERLRLSSAEKLHAAATGAYAALHGGAAASSGRGGEESGGALDGLTTAVAEIEHAAKLDERLSPLLESLQNALYAGEEAARDVRAYRDEIEFNPERLDQIETRLDTLRTLKRKYGDTLEEVLRYRAEIGERLDVLENADERIAVLESLSASREKELDARAVRLTRARKKAAGPFADAVLRELTDLAMTATRFSVAVEARPPTAKGADHVEFLLSPNPGEPLKPLAKIASGGEISRVMLAMKSVLARIVAVPTLIFDEVDTGIGGRTGSVLGEKLARLGESAQVLCITHLPQIAARGRSHLYIEKHVHKQRTIVQVSCLDADARVQEIARMLGGGGSATVLQHAREMLSVPAAV